MVDRETEVLATLKRELATARPEPWRYWVDMVGSAALGWAAIGAATALGGAVAAIGVLVAAFALWRAAYFVHELAHLPSTRLRGFTLGWNLLVGWPCGMPSVMALSHADHHRTRSYGTAGDPEYEPVATWSRSQLVLSALGGVLVPPLLWIRWAALGPLGWVCPPLRRLLIRRGSSLVTNAHYVRPLPRGPAARRLWAHEVAAALTAWGWAVAVALGALPLRAVLLTWAALALALVLNQVRTLVSHDYVSTGEPMSRAAQVSDSVTIVPTWLSAPMLPVGTGYHALHHLLPALPYHALPAAHRRLMRELPTDAAYRRTVRPSLTEALRRLFERAARQPSQARNTAGSSPRGSSGPSMHGTQ